MLKESFVNSWNIYLQTGEFYIIIYLKILHLQLHIHVGSFDKMFSLTNSGFQIL